MIELIELIELHSECDAFGFRQIRPWMMAERDGPRLTRRAIQLTELFELKLALGNEFHGLTLERLASHGLRINRVELNDVRVTGNAFDDSATASARITGSGAGCVGHG